MFLSSTVKSVSCSDVCQKHFHKTIIIFHSKNWRMSAYFVPVFTSLLILKKLESSFIPNFYYFNNKIDLKKKFSTSFLLLFSKYFLFEMFSDIFQNWMFQFHGFNLLIAQLNVDYYPRMLLELKKRTINHWRCSQTKEMKTSIFLSRCQVKVNTTVHTEYERTTKKIDIQKRWHGFQLE